MMTTESPYLLIWLIVVTDESFTCKVLYGGMLTCEQITYETYFSHLLLDIF